MAKPAMRKAVKAVESAAVVSKQKQLEAELMKEREHTILDFNRRYIKLCLRLGVRHVPIVNVTISSNGIVNSNGTLYPEMLDDDNRAQLQRTLDELEASVAIDEAN